MRSLRDGGDQAKAICIQVDNDTFHNNSATESCIPCLGSILFGRYFHFVSNINCDLKTIEAKAASRRYGGYPAHFTKRTSAYH